MRFLVRKDENGWVLWDTDTEQSVAVSSPTQGIFEAEIRLLADLLNKEWKASRKKGKH